MAELSPTQRTRVRRLPSRASYDRATMHAILDDGEDLGWPCWAGHVPLRLVALAPVPDGGQPTGAVAPNGSMHAWVIRAPA